MSERKPARSAGLTCHKGVVVGIGQAGEVRCHVIHFHSVLHQLSETGQGLHIVHVIITEAVDEEDYKFSAGLAAPREREDEDDEGTCARGSRHAVPNTSM